MANISDVIEQFILNNLGECEELEISRNELANFFSCAPSQINYVLETRFTVDRGFLKESKRGGGGYIKIVRIPFNDDDAVAELVLNNVGDELSFKRASQILDKLMRDKIVTKKERNMILSMLSDTALAMPFAYKDKLRAQSFKAVLVFLLSEKEGE